MTLKRTFIIFEHSPSRGACEAENSVNKNSNCAQFLGNVWL